MRVLLVNKFWYPNGGSERYTFLLKDLLEANGHTVIPFAMADPRNAETPWSRFFVRHVDLRDRGAQTVGNFGRMLWSREAAATFDRLLDAAQPDIVHLQNFAHQISPSILPRITRRGIPVVWTLHDYELLCPNYRMYTKGSPCERCKDGRYGNAIRYRCMGTLAASAAVAAELTLHHTVLHVYAKHLTAVIAPSRFLATKVQEWGWRGRVEWVPNFVSTADDYRSVRMATDVERPVFFVGRLTEEKGIADFLVAAKQLPVIPFTVIGDGPSAEEARSERSGVRNVRWLGKCSPQETAAHIARASMVVVPSRWYENAPYVVLEAMAAGVPVIASHIGGLPELVRDGDTGFLVSPRDPHALARAIAALYADAPRCAAMGSRAHAVSVAEYGPERHYARLREIYASCTNPQ